MPLKQYNKKRDFSKTPEPKAKKSDKKQHFFVVQKHAARRLHYDFRLELNGELLSWAVPKGPCLDPKIKRLAVEVEPHPVSYGSFEGVIPKGQYGGGTVMLWDTGKWIPLDDDPAKAFKKGHLRFIIKSKKLKGAFSLIRTHQDDKSWLLIKADDKYAKTIGEYDVLIEKSKSVASKLTMEQLTKKFLQSKNKKLVKEGKDKSSKKNNKINIPQTLPLSPMPSLIKPQLAKLTNMPPDSDQWLHELKFDGYRIVAFKKDKKVVLKTRNNLDWTDVFNNVANAIKKLPVKNAIIDGEVVLLDKNNRPNFQLLQNKIKIKNKKDFIYYVFDIMYYNTCSLKSLPLYQRKEILAAIMKGDDNNTIRYSAFMVGSGKALFAKSCKMGMEGIVSKEIDGVYEGKRSNSWLKVKCSKRQEFVIGGYTRPQGARSKFGALVLGVYNNKKQLIYCGKVGTGFTEASLHDLYKKLSKNSSKVNPFSSKPPGAGSITWLKPLLVCEIEFTEWTSDGILRHPSFKGMRSDKSAIKINRERTK